MQALRVMQSDEVYGGHVLGVDSVLANVKSAGDACAMRVLPCKLWEAVAIAGKDQVDGAESADAMACSV